MHYNGQGVLNGNKMTCPLPDELGFLPDLYRLQIKQNNISGIIPTLFINLNEKKHLHMNNKSLSGHIPSELSRLPKLIHILLDNLCGYLSEEFSTLPKLRIVQLDNEQFDGTIPDAYGNITNLLKLDISWNNLSGRLKETRGRN